MAKATKSKGKLQITVKENISFEHLQRIIASVTGASGGQGGKIRGFDFRLSVDPMKCARIAKLPGVQSVSFCG